MKDKVWRRDQSKIKADKADTWRTHGGQALATRTAHIAASFSSKREPPSKLFGEKNTPPNSQSLPKHLSVSSWTAQGAINANASSHHEGCGHREAPWNPLALVASPYRRCIVEKKAGCLLLSSFIDSFCFQKIWHNEKTNVGKRHDGQKSIFAMLSICFWHNMALLCPLQSWHLTQHEKHQIAIRKPSRLSRLLSQHPMLKRPTGELMLFLSSHWHMCICIKTISIYM